MGDFSPNQWMKIPPSARSAASLKNLQHDEHKAKLHRVHFNLRGVLLRRKTSNTTSTKQSFTEYTSTCEECCFTEKTSNTTSTKYSAEANSSTNLSLEREKVLRKRIFTMSQYRSTVMEKQQHMQKELFFKKIMPPFVYLLRL
ncbi:hypothetical protein [Lentibacillus juripiscarius]|uniref:hypothetical protein n=1 Tax=Lentibacillus juripiscarius TaxID=257446 RepID=UPI0036D308C3